MLTYLSEFHQIFEDAGINSSSSKNDGFFMYAYIPTWEGIKLVKVLLETCHRCIRPRSLGVSQTDGMNGTDGKDKVWHSAQ